MRQSGKYALAVLALHAAGIALLLPAAIADPALFGIGVLAYTLGVRHAFDADHIAAIDNVVRKLVQGRRDPLGAGFYFSLGHSTIVCVMAVGAAFFTHWASALPWFRTLGGTIGAVVSGSFLLIIGIINLVLLVEIGIMLARARRGEVQQSALARVVASRGVVARWTRPLFAVVGSSRQMYPVGFLFGLGFDTASEVALLALSASVAASALSLSAVAALPLLFASGMSLFDTADGMLMAKAYGWALSTPLRKMYYNLTVTGLSVAAALVVGCIEIFAVAGNDLDLNGGLWAWLRGVDLGNVGYLLVGAFALTLAVSYSVWRVLRLDTSRA